jgi:hypothetical protein
VTIDRRRFLGFGLAAIGGVFLPSIPFSRRGSGLIAPAPRAILTANAEAAREVGVAARSTSEFRIGDTIWIHGHDLEYVTIGGDSPPPSELVTSRLGMVSGISPICLTITHDITAHHVALPFSRQVLSIRPSGLDPASWRRPRF